MPLQATSGAASYDAFGGGVAAVPNYIEECFSTTLYTGNGSTQTITNGIDLSTKGGLVWTKGRGNFYANTNHGLFDTARGTNKFIASNLTAAQGNESTLTAFNSNGFSLGADVNYAMCNGNTENYASWTFRKQPKFFDVVTYTGNGGVQNIAHNLGSVPGCIIVKSTSQVSNWAVYHTSLGNTQFLALNQTNAATTLNYWNDTSPTSTQFTVNGYQAVGSAGQTYVAYLFAHNAGGFGLTGTDNVISCGSYTTDGSGYAEVNLGYEPQFILRKSSSTTDNWFLMDNMRGLDVGGTSDAILIPNTSGAEVSGSYIDPTATGFIDPAGGAASRTFIYIAIRRGPMKVPTSGTSVFSPSQWPGSGYPYSTGTQYTGFPVDSLWANYLSGNSWNTEVYDRLRKASSTNSSVTGGLLSTATTDAESTNGSTQAWFNATFNQSRGSGYIYYAFGRAPSFFDEVCYTGTGSATTQTHNLGVVPELMIVKDRTYDWGSDSWAVYSSALGATKYLALSRNVGEQTSSSFWNDTAPTASVFTVGTIAYVNAGGDKYVAYLFATCAGVSKVTSFTGNGSSQTINCGFTGGARLVLIKRTDSTGDWYIWDSARGIVSGNDPHLSLNSTAAEVTTDDTIDTDSTGFIVNQVSATNCNVNGANYIVLAVA